MQLLLLVFTWSKIGLGGRHVFVRLIFDSCSTSLGFIILIVSMDFVIWYIYIYIWSHHYGLFIKWRRPIVAVNSHWGVNFSFSTDRGLSHQGLQGHDASCCIWVVSLSCQYCIQECQHMFETSHVFVSPYLSYQHPFNWVQLGVSLLKNGRILKVNSWWNWDTLNVDVKIWLTPWKHSDWKPTMKVWFRWCSFFKGGWIYFQIPMLVFLVSNID